MAVPTIPKSCASERASETKHPTSRQPFFIGQPAGLSRSHPSVCISDFAMQPCTAYGDTTDFGLCWTAVRNDGWQRTPSQFCLSSDTDKWNGNGRSKPMDRADDPIKRHSPGSRFASS
jgi:hypothetical protein